MNSKNSKIVLVSILIFKKISLYYKQNTEKLSGLLDDYIEKFRNYVKLLLCFLRNFCKNCKN